MRVLGQIVNNLKSEIYFINMDHELEKQIYVIMGYKVGSFTCKYLGIELEKGVKSNKVWNKIV